MAVYYARHSSGQNFGVYLDVWRLETTADRVNVGVSGGHHSYAGSWYFTAYASLSYYENSGHDWESGNYSVSGSGDKPWFSATDFFWRREYDRSINLYCYEEVTVNGQYGTANANVWITVPHLPNAPTNLNATYVSDNQINLSWTAPTRSYGAMCLEVSIDGGSWSEFSVIYNTATQAIYNQATADHSYRFRARAFYLNAYSPYTSETVAIATSPAAPTAISTAAVEGTTVTVNVTNDSAVATKLQYEISTDGGETWGATQDSQSLSSFDVSISGTGRVRVRNWNATGVSSWLESDDVTTICPPAPPTLTAPAGTVLNLSDGSVTFSWLHNSIDGSAQTAANLQYSADGGQTWTSIPMNPKTDNSYTISPIPWAVGTTVKWQMQTKGADASFSDPSDPKEFNVYTAPTVNITSPADTITSMPVELVANYSDMTDFTCKFASVKLMQEGREVYPNDPNKGTSASGDVTINGSTITASLTTDEFLPTNGESYTVVLSVRSSSTLQASANTTFRANFKEPVAGSLQVQNDSDTGYVSLLATYDNDDALTWNQAFPRIWRDNQYSGWSLSVSGDNRLHITATQTVSENFSNNFFNYTPSWTIGHKYAFLVAGDQRFAVNLKSYNLFTPTIFTAAENKYTNIAMKFTDLPEGEYTFSPLLVDLTEIFGAGNEPASVDDSRIAMLVKYGTQNPEYDEGSDMIVEAESISVARVNPDGTLTPLLAEVQSGTGIVDKYAPLNTEYQYAVTTTAESKAVNTVYVSNTLRSERWFAYWNTVKDNAITENIAWAVWNPSGNYAITRPEKKRVHYVGRKWALSYDSRAMEQSQSISWTVVPLEDWRNGFEKLMDDGGRGVYKGCDGWVYHADFDYSNAPNYTSIGGDTKVSLSITRIDGEQL